jgi:hypothetical protein
MKIPKSGGTLIITIIQLTLLRYNQYEFLGGMIVGVLIMAIIETITDLIPNQQQSQIGESK